jgi:hypothetical protein
LSKGIFSRYFLNDISLFRFATLFWWFRATWVYPQITQMTQKRGWVAAVLVLIRGFARIVSLWLAAMFLAFHETSRTIPLLAPRAACRPAGCRFETEIDRRQATSAVRVRPRWRQGLRLFHPCQVFEQCMAALLSARSVTVHKPATGSIPRVDAGDLQRNIGRENGKNLGIVPVHVPRGVNRSRPFRPRPQ